MSQSTNNGGPSEDDPIIDHNTSEGQAEVIRILRWPAWAYYKILNLEENAEESQIRQAYRKRSMLAHPDRNTDPDANEVMQSEWVF